MNKEMTRYAFISHMVDYIKNLLCDPINAKTDEFFQDFGIDGPVALKMLLKRADPNDENSAIIVRSERIKDNGVDDNGKRNKDTFEIKYKVPRKDFQKKLRNLYINLFEQNIIEDSPIKENLTEGAWGYGPLDNDSALDFQTEFANVALNVLTSKVRQSKSNDDLWANLGVLIDFIKKYKDDEIQLTDEYNEAIELAKSFLSDILTNQSFINNWSEPDKFKSSVKKLLKDISLLKYQKEIMNSTQNITPGGPRQIIPPIMPSSGPILEDGEGGGAMGSVGGVNGGNGEGATTTFSVGGKGGFGFTAPMKYKKHQNESDDSDVIRRKTMYITQEQADYIKEATTTTNTGDYQFTVPLGDENDDFYGEAMDHTEIMKKSMPRNNE